MHDERQYHRRREQHCREQAASATDPAIRKCHEQLADLHAAALLAVALAS
jgi:hypothetical protein